MKNKPSNKLWALNRNILIAVIAFVLLAAAAYVFWGQTKVEPTAPPSPNNTTSPTEPQFKKEGELYFIDKQTKKTIKKISIEKADDEAERMQGLMYRHNMADSLGMLFIFDQAEEQSFWMKNTPLSLDMIFVDANLNIIRIHKYTTPYSDRSYASGMPAQYVVEVVGGFTDKYKISEGDKVQF